MSMISASGFGIATINKDGYVLDAWFPNPKLDFSLSSETIELEKSNIPNYLIGFVGFDSIRNVKLKAIHTKIDSLQSKPSDVYDLYLRLHLLSHRLIKPNMVNLNGIFNKLTNVLWTNRGPCMVEDFKYLRTKLEHNENIKIYSIDKFPRMLNYVFPSGIRIANSSNVRLGAYLAKGTTVMHSGFVNFNSGTLGASMIEGRVSSGVVIGDGSDIGGGASIMGSLSGGGKEIISIGKRCLIGANSGIGISLGNDCIIEAGLYITKGTKVTNSDGKTYRAIQLSKPNNVLFRRNSLSGVVEVIDRNIAGISLNKKLHEQ